METAELAKLVKGRRSIHAWQDKPVPEELLVQAVELATWAPNGGNQQNWFFYIILDKGTINAVADAIDGARSKIMAWPEMAQAMAGPGGPPRPGNVPPAGGPPLGGAPPQRRDALRTAPALIVVTSQRSENPMDKAIAERAKTDPKAKQVIDGLNTVASRIQSVSAAIAYLLLVLHQLGLGSVWMTGPMQAKAEIEKALKVPQGWDAVALIPVGYSAESPVKDRKPVSEVIQIIK